jgi:pimeloyl-ACP methyl ester carboxylesterase
MPERRVVTVGGFPVNIVENPGKALILLTRMASQEAGIWDPIWSGFAEYFTVANFELGGQPGLHRTGSPAEVFGLLASRCVEVAAGLGFERFHLFGWVGGTQVALRCLVDHGPRVASAILLNPFFQLPDMRKIEKAIEFKRVLFSHENRELYAYYWSMAGFTPAFLEKHFDVVEQLARARIAKDRFVRADVEQFTQWVRAIRTNWISDQVLARIAAPVLVVGTTLDNWHAGPTAEMARALAARIPTARLEVMEHAGSMIFLEDPARFMRLVLPFIRAVLR